MYRAFIYSVHFLKAVLCATVITVDMMKEYQAEIDHLQGEKTVLQRTYVYVLFPSHSLCLALLAIAHGTVLPWWIQYRSFLVNTSLVSAYILLVSM